MGDVRWTRWLIAAFVVALLVLGGAVAVAVTGYAGPGGGNEKNPVGTVYVASSRKGSETLVERHVFPGDRDTVRMKAVAAALSVLARRLL